MNVASERTPVALFVALTRAVRDALVPDEVRKRAFDIIDRMARTVGLSGFELELKALIACVHAEPSLGSTLEPLWTELRELSESGKKRFGTRFESGLDESTALRAHAAMPASPETA